MFFFDTNFRMSHTSSSLQKEMTHGHWENHLCPTHGLSTRIRISDNAFNDTTATTRSNSFSCWNQFLCMAFAQLTYRESLRDIEACLRSAQRKLYHMGFRGNVSRNTLAHANQVRDWRIYADFAQILIGQARRLYANDSFGVELNQTAYALDSTTIDLCLSLFPWAKFRAHKGAVKLHTLLDLRGSIPSAHHYYPWQGSRCQHSRSADLRTRSLLHLSTVDIWISLAFTPIHQASAFFVTRAKSNFRFRRLYSRPVDKSDGVQSDQIIVLEGFYSHKSLSRQASAHSLFRCRPKQTAESF